MRNDDGFRKPVSIVIPNYNGYALLEKYLPHTLAAAQNYSPDTEIIVVDDASNDGSVEFLEKNHPEVQVIKLPQNVGFSYACDAGIRAARSDRVILLNTDVRVSEGFIAPLVSHFSDESVFAVMSMSLSEDERQPVELTKVPFFKRGYIKFVSSKHPELMRMAEEADGSLIYSFYAVGGHCAIDKSKYFLLNGFDDIYYPFYWEDVDLCYRGWKRGWKTIFEPRSVVYHSISGPIRSEFRRSYRAGIIRRNRFLFMWKNITSVKYFYFRHMIPVLLRIVGGLFILDFDYYRALLGALSRLSQVRDRRKQEKCIDRKLSDEEIFELTRSPFRRVTKRSKQSATGI